MFCGRGSLMVKVTDSCVMSSSLVSLKTHHVEGVSAQQTISSNPRASDPDDVVPASCSHTCNFVSTAGNTTKDMHVAAAWVYHLSAKDF
ncbi:hypothetical protein TNCV_4987811 [Trichonephila clavipes]|nr:hypothetical protein TNCV_4987811 [Trichonephila clavipes]